MKFLIIALLMFSVGASGVIGGAGTLDPVQNSGVIGDIDTLRTLPSVIEIKELANSRLYDLNKLTSKLLRSGEYDFDTESNRWLLKTRSRILSVENIELIDSYQDKQIEVLNFSSNIKRRMKNIGSQILEKRIQRGVRFKSYNIKDFNY